MGMFPIVSIDGPAASGKSSVSQAVARRLGATFASSGELYRAVTWSALEAEVPAESGMALNTFLSQLHILSQEHFGKIVFLIHGMDPTPHLSDESVNRNIPLFSRLPEFRKALLEPLRDLRKRFPLVMEGRDIGSVVFPETPYKFYLDASEEERQRRRSAQGITDTVADRDRLDSTRKAAPLVVPPGAQIIDTTHLPLDEVAHRVLALLRNQGFSLTT